MLVNYDQFSAGDATLNEWYDKTWISKLRQSNLTERDIERVVEAKTTARQGMLGRSRGRYVEKQ